MKLSLTRQNRYLGYAASAIAVSLLATAVTGVGYANQAEAETLLQHALRLADLYNWAGASESFSEAERLFIGAKDERGALHARLGRLRATVEQNERGLLSLSAGLADELDQNSLLRADRRLRMFALIIKGDIDAEVETASMKADWTEVQALAQELGDSKWQYRALAQLGLAAFYDGDIESARTNVSSAVIAATQAGDRGALIRYLSAMGIGLVQTNTSEQALPYFEQALKMATSTPESGYPFLTQEGKCAALLRLKRFSEAEALGTEVLRNAREGGRSAHEAVALRTLASVQIAGGNHSAALKLLDEGIAIAERFDHVRTLADLQAIKADVLSLKGDFDAAEAAAEAAARASQENGDVWGVPRRLQLLADLYSRLGKYDKADDMYGRAGAFVDALIGRASTVVDKTALIRTSGDIFTKHFSLVVDRFNDTERAFAIVEQVRGRAARDLLMAGSRMSPTLRDTERNISKLRIRLMSARSTTEVRKLRDEIFLAEQARWSQPGRSTVNVSVSEAAKLSQIRSVLTSSEAILTFVLAEPRSYCLVITRGSSRVIPLSSKQVIDGQIDAYRRAVDANLRAGKEARGLYRTLLAPIRETTAARKLIIVRDGALHRLPFDALVGPSGAYVVQAKIVEYAPSATGFYVLSRSRNNGKDLDGPRTALAVGGIPYASTRLATGDATRGYRSAFTNLPSSADEAIAVRAAIGSSRTTLLTGPQATETALVQADLHRYEIIHFGVHGLANSVYPDRAALILLSDKRAGDDGFLQSPEIVELRLNANLVVLSACESAAGPLQGQEGVANLSRAFLLAGARAVVSSLWTVDDKSSLYLMRRFYRGVADGKPFAIALAESKREMIRDFGPNAVPSKWAAFTLEGLGAGSLSDIRFRVRSRAR
jgi:CHAT domain-containing protein